MNFNKEEVFDGSTKTLKSDIKNIFLEYLAEIIKKTIRTVIIIILPTIYNNTAKDLEWSYKNEGKKKRFDP